MQINKSKLSGLRWWAFFMLFGQWAVAVANPAELQKGWEAFNANQRPAARQHFISALKDPQTKAEAQLMLAIVEYYDENADLAFGHFKAFFTQSPNPYPYAYALWNSDILQGGQLLNDDRLAFFRAMAADPKADGTLRAMANHALGRHFQRVGKFEEAEKHFALTGAVATWQLAGEFDNVSASGYEKNHPPIQQPEASAEFLNREGAKVKWFVPKALRNDRWIDFSYHLYFGNAVVYAQNFVNSPTDQEVELRLGVSGSLKVWLNDALVGGEAEERNTDMDVYNYPVKLRKGYNRILVQVGESEVDQSNFMLRITNQQGDPIQGLTYSASYQPYSKATAAPATLLPMAAERFFEQRLQVASPSVADQLLLAEVYLRNDKSYGARRLLLAAQQVAPNNSYIAARLIDAFSRDQNRTEISKTAELIREKDPDGAVAITLAINEAKEKEDYDEMERQIERLAKLQGERESVMAQRLQLLVLRKSYDKMLELGNQAYAKYPDNYAFANLRAAIADEVEKNPRLAMAVWERFLKNNYSPDAVEALTKLHLEQGTSAKGLKVYTELAEHYPYSVGYLSALAKYYFGLRDYAKALAWQQKTLELAPYVGAYWTEVGRIHEEMGNPAQAREAYTKGIGYAPTNYEVRKKLRKLEKKQDVYAYFAQPDVYALMASSPKVDKNSGEASILLHQEVQQIIYPEGGSEERNILVVKVLNSSGIDNWKEYSIDYNGNNQRLIVEKAEVLKANGSKVAAESNDEGYVVFTALEVGDAIHLNYRLENYASGKLANHFWGKFHFNYFVPAKHVKYSLLVPQGRQFKHFMANAKLEPEVKPMDEFVLHTWERKDQPKIKGEAYMPPLSDVGETLYLSSMPDWNYVAQWYADLANTKARADFEVKEAVAGLFADQANLTDEQKARRIYEYIVQNIRYSSTPFRQSAYTPQRAARTLSTRLGDCKDVSVLFVAMAQEVGLKSNLVLIDTRDNGEQDMRLPSVGFNHCVARVVLGGKERYLELTDNSLPFGTATGALKGAISLNIPRDDDKAAHDLKLLSWTTRPTNAQVLYTDISFENSDMVLKRRVVREGIYAAGTRESNANVTPEEQEKGILQSFSSSFNTPVKVQALKFDDGLHNLADSLSYDYSIQVKNALVDIGGLKIMALPWKEGEKSAEVVSEETRSFPLNYWNYDISEAQKEVITLTLPKGKVLAEMPKSQKISFEGWEYSINYKMVGDKLVITRQTNYKNDVVSPEKYPQFKEFFNKMVEADTKQVAFK
jgi:tetratricopeptide (TPR) repeat protein